ncbi:UBX domain-containing protein 6-like [Acanthaster planci]|uniref:UBX domain-containing protein 6-like n=1 Tax=Acanthaster planci TaxID=133434 RepID=A0A8B7ZL07_ACAPL|nr:UBX domain-containing protein 6-like [Acanthaster planci]
MEMQGSPSLKMASNQKMVSCGDKRTDNFRDSSTPPERVNKDDNRGLSVSCVFFQCPFGCSAIYSKATIDHHLLIHLKRMLQCRPLEASVLMIHSLSRNKERLQAGLQILCKYLDNVCNNPTEEKYRKISEHNKIFQERVVPVVGARDFLEAVGFKPKKLLCQDTEMPFLVMSKKCASDVDQIKSARDVLLNTQPSEATLHRDVRIYYPSHKAEEFHLPRDFYDIIPGSQANDPRESRRYQYTIIRIRFPDGVLLQGTFHVEEKLSAVKAFISLMLEKEWQPFVLRDTTDRVMSAMNSTLRQLKLVPGAVMNFGFNATIEAEMATGLYFCLHGPVKGKHHLKANLMRTIKVL